MCVLRDFGNGTESWCWIPRYSSDDMFVVFMGSVVFVVLVEFVVLWCWWWWLAGLGGSISLMGEI